MGFKDQLHARSDVRSVTFRTRETLYYVPSTAQTLCTLQRVYITTYQEYNKGRKTYN